MKVITILSLLLLTSAAFGELTKADLHDLKEDLHKVIKEESAASEKRMKEHIDLKIETVNARIDAVERDLNTRIDAVDKSLGRVWFMIAVLSGLITATIAIPQIIIAHRESGRKEMQTQIDQLREQIKSMQNTLS